MIGETCANCAAGHSVELRACWILDQDQSAGRLDLLQTLCAVRSCCREDDSGGAFLALLGKRLEQHVDRMAMATRLVRAVRRKASPSTFGSSRRDNVNMVWSHMQAILDLARDHCRVQCDDG